MSGLARPRPALRLAALILVPALGLSAASVSAQTPDPAAPATALDAQLTYTACTRLALAPWPAHPIPRRAHLQRLESARPQCVGHAQFLAVFGALWLEEGEPNQALIWLERALLLDPGNLGAQADHALALAALGQPDALKSLAQSWQNRSDIPPALRERLLPPKAASASDPFPRVRLGGMASGLGNGRWASFREATVLLGVESNLDHSPKLAEITLTPQEGPITLPLVTPLVPRRGAAISSELAWQLARSPQAGQVWRAGMNLGARVAPGETKSNWHHVQLAGSLSQQWAPWRAQFEIGASWVGGPLNEPYRVERAALTLERNALGCMLRVAVEGENRLQRETVNTDGRTAGLLWSSQCPINGERRWSWGFAARGAVDEPVDASRAGGTQRLWSVGARLLGQLGPDLRLESNLRLTRTRDDEGYNPLLEDNARRELRQMQWSMELSRPVVLPGGLAAEGIVQLHAVHQRSNLSVFRYTAISAYGGLRWSW